MAAAAVNQYLLPMPNLSSKPVAAAAAVDTQDRQTDGHSIVL